MAPFRAGLLVLVLLVFFVIARSSFKPPINSSSPSSASSSSSSSSSSSVPSSSLSSAHQDADAQRQQDEDDRNGLTPFNGTVNRSILRFPLHKLKTLLMCEPYQADASLIKRLRDWTPVCNRSRVTELLSTRFTTFSKMDAVAPGMRHAEESGGQQHPMSSEQLAEAAKSAAFCRRRERKLIADLNASLPTAQNYTCARDAMDRLIDRYSRSHKPWLKRNIDDDDEDAVSSSNPQPQQQQRQQSPLRVVVIFILTTGGGKVAFPLERPYLLHSFIETHNPLTDEIHVVTDHAIGMMERLSDTMRRLVFRKRKGVWKVVPRRPPPQAPSEETCVNESTTTTITTTTTTTTTTRAPTTTDPAGFISYADLDNVVPKIRIINCSAWATEMKVKPRAPKTAPTQFRFWTLLHYLDVYLPTTFPGRRIASVITVDARDTIMQTNVFDALDVFGISTDTKKKKRKKQRKKRTSMTKTSKSSKSAPLSSVASSYEEEEEDDDEYVFVSSEIIIAYRSWYQKNWQADIFSMPGARPWDEQVLDMYAYEPGKMLDPKSAWQLANCYDCYNSSWEAVLRKLPDGSSAFPSICSGVYGGSYHALREFVQQLLVPLTDCTTINRIGVDQGMLASAVIFGVQLVNFPFRVEILSPETSPIRNVIPNEHVAVFPKDTAGRLLNCVGYPYSVLHQIDRSHALHHTFKSNTIAMWAGAEEDEYRGE